jgi:hypothetical protein
MLAAQILHWPLQQREVRQAGETVEGGDFDGRHRRSLAPKGAGGNFSRTAGFSHTDANRYQGV